MLRRPMLFAAFGCAAAVILSYYAGVAAAVLVLTAGASAFACSGASDGKRTAAIVLLISYSLGIAAFWHDELTFAKNCAGLDRIAESRQEADLRGEIIDCETKIAGSGDPYLQMTLRTEYGRIICKSYENCPIEGEAEEGRVAEISGKLQDPEGRRNPNCFDYALYLRSIGVIKTMRCAPCGMTRRRNGTSLCLTS